jgi:hypothetical protein
MQETAPGAVGQRKTRGNDREERCVGGEEEVGEGGRRGEGGKRGASRGAASQFDDDALAQILEVRCGSVFSATTGAVKKKHNCLCDDIMEQMTIVGHFVCSPRYEFDTVATKMAADVEKHKKPPSGARARAVTLDGRWRRCRLMNMNE